LHIENIESEKKVDIPRGAWFDGWFYAKFFDSDKLGLRKYIVEFVEDGSSIIDIGCATGGLALNLAPRSKYVVGVDVSEKMIKQALKRRNKLGYKNLDFILIDALDLSSEIDNTFDYAVLSFVIHEIPQKERIRILTEAMRIADNIIILDYHFPQPQGFWGISIKWIEFFAGREHYRCFRDYLQRGGLKSIFGEMGLRIIREGVDGKRAFSTVIVQKQK